MKKYEHKQAKAKLIVEARKIAERDGPQTQEDKDNIKKIMDEVADHEARITVLEQLEDAEDSEEQAPVEAASRSHGMDVSTRKRGNIYATPEYRSAWLKANIHGDYAGALAELRDGVLVGTDNVGGFAVTPTTLVDDVQKLINNQVWIRKYATPYKVDMAKGGRVPLISSRIAPAAWGATEITSTSVTTPTYSNRDLTPHLLSALCKSSVFDLQQAANTEELLIDEIAYSQVQAQETSYFTGSGSGQGLGVMVASSSGINTDRDVDTGSTTAITADCLMRAKYKVLQQYLDGSDGVCWFFHPDAMTQIALLKDSQNRYLLGNLGDGSGDKLLNIPVRLSYYMPATFTAGQYVGILGNFREYAIADWTQGVQIVKLDQLFQQTHQIGYVGRTFTDSAPRFSQAFARLITSAS